MQINKYKETHLRTLETKTHSQNDKMMIIQNRWKRVYNSSQNKLKQTQPYFYQLAETPVFKKNKIRN